MDVHDSGLDEKTIKKLIEESFAAKLNAYCPYNGFPVGAAILCTDGTVIRGSNVGNAVHGLDICAERVAIGAAVTAGHRRFSAIAIASNVKDEFIQPCGACRQVLAEFGLDWFVCATKPDKSYVIKKVSDLLPNAYTPSMLQLDRVTHDDAQK